MAIAKSYGLTTDECGNSRFSNNCTTIDIGAVETNPSCCIYEDTTVQTTSGEKYIKNIISGDIVRTFNDAPLIILFNAKFAPVDDFYKIPKNALGSDTPNRDFYIHGDHPIWYDNREILVKDLIGIVDGVTFVKFNKLTNVYSLCTQERTYFKACGNLFICTWSLKDFNEQINNKIYFQKL